MCRQTTFYQQLAHATFTSSWSLVYTQFFCLGLKLCPVKNEMTMAYKLGKINAWKVSYNTQ